MMVDYVQFDNPQKVRLGDNRVVQAFGKHLWHQIWTFEYKQFASVTRSQISIWNGLSIS